MTPHLGADCLLAVVCEEISLSCTSACRHRAQAHSAICQMNSRARGSSFPYSHHTRYNFPTVHYRRAIVCAFRWYIGISRLVRVQGLYCYRQSTLLTYFLRVISLSYIFTQTTVQHSTSTMATLSPVLDQLPAPATTGNGTPTTGPRRSTTPIRKSSQLERQFSTLTCYRDPTLAAIGVQMTGCVVGPMPVADFLDTFLPASLIPSYQSTANRFQAGAFEQCIDAKDELGMYKPFVSTSG